MGRRRKKTAYERRQDAIRVLRRAMARRIHTQERRVDAIMQVFLKDREKADPVYNPHRQVMESLGAALRNLLVAVRYCGGSF